MDELNNATSSMTAPLTGSILSEEDYAANESARSTPGLEETFVLPASREQTRYWMLAQLDPASTASNMAIAFDISGEMKDEAVEAAIAALTMRHEALRTIFRLEAGVLSQVILNRPLYRFQTEDLSALQGDDRDQAAENAVSRHGHTVIDLHSGPVLHAQLIHLDQQHHILALTMNHIVCDGWSNGILIRDFTLIYEAILTGKEALLPELPFQFADFALWQQEYMQSPHAEKAADFWKSHVTSDLPALEFPTDFSRTTGRNFPGHIESALLPKAVDEKLIDYCRTFGSTKHIVLLAAFEALCARYTGQSKFLLGSTIANRTQPGMENVVGRFANPQIIVANVNGDPSFAALERSVREGVSEAYNHQDLPFSRIIEDFQITQTGASSQFLQVWFLYQKAFMQPQTGSSILVTPRRSVSGGVDFDLLVSIVERAEGPRIQMEYNTQLFLPARIRHLISSFTSLLGDVLRDPSHPLSALPHINCDKLDPGNLPPSIADDVSMVASNMIFDLLRKSTANRMETIAVADASKRLNWVQLDEQSSAVAAEMQRRGVTTNSVVAVHLAEVSTSVTALLGALKIGASVLPLPWHSTKAGVETLLTKLPCSLLVAPKDLSTPAASACLFFDEFQNLSLGADFEPNSGAKLLFLTDAAEARFETVSLAVVTASLSAAAEKFGLMFASMENQESILAFPAAGPMEGCLDRLMAVISGSQLIFGHDLATIPLDEVLAKHQITRLVLSPSDLTTITRQGWNGDRRVALVLRGGRLRTSLTPREQTDQLPSLFRSAVYLLSEPSLGGYLAYKELSHSRLRSGLVAFSGELSVRDQQQKPVPPGAYGRLHLNGAAAGYMARNSSDSLIETAERDNRFVQLHGRRICLSEIEDALLPLASVEGSVAAVTEVKGDAYLSVYLVSFSSKGDGIDDPKVDEHLSATLPSYMIPDNYVWLKHLPLALDGRFNLSTLSLQNRSRRTQTNQPVAVMTAVEEKLAAIWRDVLGLRHVDVDTPFFEVGGTSLLLVRLFAKVNKAFDTSLPITAIFDAKTIAALAKTLGSEPNISPLVQVQTTGSKPALFMIHSYLLYKGLSTSLGADQPFYGLRELDCDGQLTIEERVNRYVTEIRQVQTEGPYNLAGWCAAGPLTVEVARQLILAGEKVSYMALFDSWLPGYLESIESQKSSRRRLPFAKVASKFSYHRRKMVDLNTGKKLRYVWMASTRVLREARYHLYLKNWKRLRRLSDKYHFTLPQFMHNTSLDTFSALKDYQEKRLPVRLTLIRATDSREIPGAAISCGWERVAEHGVDVIWAPGDHETMFVGTNLEATTLILERGLASANRQLWERNTFTDVSGDQKSNHPRGPVLHVDCPIL